MQTKLNFKQIFTAGLMAAGVSAILNAILFFAETGCEITGFRVLGTN